MTEYDQKMEACRLTSEELEVILVQLLRLAEADGIFDDAEKMMIQGLIKKYSSRFSNIEKLLLRKERRLDITSVKHSEQMVLYMIMLAYCDGKLSEEEWIQIKETADLMGIDDNRLNKLHIIVKEKLFSTILCRLSDSKINNEVKTKFLSDVKHCLSI